jgi:SAM-dependent methyltransferase
MPVVCNALFGTSSEALAVERGDLHLVFCRSCAFIYNRSFDAARVPYGAHYENSLNFSPAFRRFADELTRRLVDRYAVRGGRVIEIACGNGEFLSALCAQGECDGVGFDPSYVASRGPQELRGRIEVRAEQYSEAHAGLPAELVCCRHALEHMEDPLGFLRMLRRALEAQRDTVLYFEVPNGTWILDEFDLWDLIYEHFGYFCRESLGHLFRRAGFEVLDSGEAFDRQFLWVEARPGDAGPAERPDTREMEARVEAFADTCREKVRSWDRELEILAGQGRRAAVWGAGSKGITFLNLFRDRPALVAAVDVNPHKAGMYISGTGHPISSPEDLAGAQAPDVFVVMNPAYLDEIEARARELGLSGSCRAV